MSQSLLSTAFFLLLKSLFVLLSQLLSFPGPDITPRSTLSMSHEPTLIFVPGAWHLPSTWDKLTYLLETRQYTCVTVSLPTAAADPSASFSDDYGAVRDAIVAETTQAHNVVLIAHSYGGQVANSAIKGLTRPKQESTSSTDDKSGHVTGLILLASGFTLAGYSFLDGLGGNPPPSWTINNDTGYAEIVVDPRQLFYHDLPEEEGAQCASKLTRQSVKAMSEGAEYTYAGWMDVPVWYLATVNDQALPIAAQRMFVQMAKDAGGDITVKEVDSSHSPMLSKPEETAQFVLEAINAFDA